MIIPNKITGHARTVFPVAVGRVAGLVVVTPAVVDDCPTARGASLHRIKNKRKRQVKRVKNDVAIFPASRNRIAVIFASY